MSIVQYIPIGSAVIGAVAAGVAHNKPQNRTIDNVVVPIGGFLAGGVVGNAATIVAIEGLPIENKLASVGVDLASLGAGYWAFKAWQEGKKGHTMAGSVGMGLLATYGANIALRAVDRVATKLLPPSVPEVLVGGLLMQATPQKK